MKRLIARLLAFTLATSGVGICVPSAGAAVNPAPGTWVQYPAYNASITYVADTPGRSFFMGYPQVYNAAVNGFNDPGQTLFYLDKATGEVHEWQHLGHPSARALCMGYDWKGKCLAIAYKDLDVDLVFDDGRIVNVPDLADLRPRGARPAINDIRFDHDRGLVYLALSSGFAVIDENTGRMDYHQLDAPVASAAPMGDLLVLVSNSQVYWAPLADIPSSIADFNLTDTSKAKGATRLLPLGDTLCAYIRVEWGAYKVAMMHVVDGALVWKESLFGYEAKTPSETPDGYWFPASNQDIRLYRDGKWNRLPRAEEDMDAWTATTDGRNVFFVTPRGGVRTKTLGEDDIWPEGVEPTLPNFPSVYHARSIAWSPIYGVLAVTHGIDHYFMNTTSQTYYELTGYRSGKWSHYGYAYTNPEQKDVISAVDGIAVDPLDPHKAYIGSYTRGLLRVNLADPKDVMHISSANDKSKNLPGFVVGRDTQKAWDVCRFAAPAFDNDGWLWSCDFDMDRPAGNSMVLWMWSPEDRLASVDSASFRPWKSLVVPATGSNLSKVLPLRHSSNEGLVVVVPNTYDDMALIIYDHAGTPDDPSDDSSYPVGPLFNAEGYPIHSMKEVRCLTEDPKTGMLWVGSEQGLYTLNPRSAMRNPSLGATIDCTAPDGSQFLLGKNLPVTCIFCDANNDKWIGFQDAGLVHTDPTGTKARGIYTTANSDIPSDMVLALGQDLASGDMIVSTGAGLARLVLPSSDPLLPGASLAVSPSALTPGFKGWVTISNTVPGSDVTVTDEEGRAVRTLRPSSDSLQWDGSDDKGRPLPAGIYRLSSGHSPAVSLHILR